MFINLLVIIFLQCGSVLTQGSLKMSTVNMILQELRDSLDHYNYTSKLAISLCNNCSLSWEQRNQANGVLLDRFASFLNEIQNATKDGAPLKPIFSNFTTVTQSQSAWPSLILNVWGSSSEPEDKLPRESAELVLEAFVAGLVSSNYTETRTMGPYYVGYEKKLCICQSDYVVQAAISNYTSRYQLLKTIDRYFSSSTVQSYYVSSEFGGGDNGTSIRNYFTGGLNETSMSTTVDAALASLRVEVYSTQVTPLKTTTAGTTTNYPSTTYVTKSLTASTLISAAVSSTSTFMRNISSATNLQTTSSLSNTVPKTTTSRTSTETATSVLATATSSAKSTYATTQKNSTVTLSPNSSTNSGMSTNSSSTTSKSFSTTSDTGLSNNPTTSTATTDVNNTATGQEAKTPSQSDGAQTNATSDGAKVNICLNSSTNKSVSNNLTNETTSMNSTNGTADGAVKLINKLEDFMKYSLLHITIPSLAGILLLVLGCWFCLYYGP